MQPKTNQLARQISSVPKTHRDDTLTAISKKTHAVTARIEFLKVEGQKMHDLLQGAPDDALSRLAWLNSQLHQQ